MKKRIIVVLFFPLFIVGACLEEDQVRPHSEEEKIVFIAESGERPTKTAFQADETSIWWSPGDEICVFYGASSRNQFISTNETEVAKAEFHGTLNAFTGVNDAGELNYFWAVYPFSAANTCDGNGVIASLAPGQEAKAGSFAKNVNIAIAKSTGLALSFYNVCSWFRFSLTKEGVKRVSFNGNNDETVAGVVKVSMDENGKPIIQEKYDNFSKIILTPPNGEAFEVGKMYYITLFPQIFENGFTVTMETDNEIGSRVINSKASFLRSKYNTGLDFDKDVVYISREHTLETERESLLDIYESGGGDFWDDNTNWCSNSPVGEWAGVLTDENGFVRGLILQSLHGYLSESIGNLKYLEVLCLYGELNGIIPRSIDKLVNLKQLTVLGSEIEGDIDIEWNNLKKLRELVITGHNISGTIPESIGELSNLEILLLNTNRFTGAIPRSICNLKNLQVLDLSSNLLTGTIPDQIGEMSSLRELLLRGHSGEERYGNDPDYKNNITGTIPASIQNLSNLETLDLSENMLTGTLPDYIWSIPNLRYLNLSFNRFSGELSAEIKNATKLESLELNTNELSGTLPDELWQLSNLCCLNIGNHFEKYGVLLEYGNCFTGTLSNNLGQLQNLESLILANNNFTGEIPESISTLKLLRFLNIRNNNFSGSIPVGIKDLNNLWFFNCQRNKLSGKLLSDFATIYKEWNKMAPDSWSFTPQQEGYAIEWVNDYESTDFSQHGALRIIQTATVGKGINIVLMCDGFLDKEVSDGTYDYVSDLMYEAIFDIEPFKSFSDYFNVYQITLVSKNDDSIIGETALGIHDEPLWGFSFSGIEMDKTKQMIQNLLPDVDMNRLTISIATKAKSLEVNGVAYMSDSSDDSLPTAGLGICISHYEPGLESFSGTVQHEVCGHGFGKLADEYVREAGLTLPDDSRSLIVERHKKEWYVNIDITSNPDEIIWRKFLINPAYSREDIGIFEGGYAYYSSGVWRPSSNSIMRSSSSCSDFNAPSREIIYKRIHNEAFGEDWTYDWSEFVEWDRKNIQTSRKPLSPLILKTPPAKIIEGGCQNRSCVHMY